jgi:predicted phosphoribosyltransferase
MDRVLNESSSEQPPFRDRATAGVALAEALRGHQGRDVVVIGIPRGGVAVAAEVARLLDADLDVAVARKLGAPGQEELAVGAVTADGSRILNDDVIALLNVSEPYLRAVTEVQVTEARRREQWLRSLRPAVPVAGRTVILVDDGLATGATMRVTARAIRRQGPARLIVAVPVGARQACEALRSEVDEVVCLRQPEPFHAIGLYYRDFEQVEDHEVRRLLETAHEARVAG